MAFNKAGAGNGTGADVVCIAAIVGSHAAGPCDPAPYVGGLSRLIRLGG